MIKVISSERVPIKLWLDDIEEGALQQARNLANLPFIYKHLAVMPDAHAGFGMPIGGVFAAVDTVVPNAVGVDIGCGMCAARSNLRKIEKKQLQRIMDLVRHGIPVGADHHRKPQDESLMPAGYDVREMCIVGEEYHSALRQIGTLGSGNHFIEIQQGNDGYIWIMVHSGSRNIGLKVAEHYNRKAVRMNQLWFSQVEKSKELAFLPMETAEARDYFREMNFCVEFAFANRRLMTQRIQSWFREVMGNHVEFEPLINIAHNYARREIHFGKEVIVHRKGATSAQEGETGIIPGSQGTKSYIVEGLGNPESFRSCSHGAGRRMGRNQAIKNLDLSGEIAFMDRQGILHGIRTAGDLDEAPGAYKDIGEVMENQKDLVRIRVELRPLAVVKG